MIPLPLSFYEQPVLDLAPALIGKILVHDEARAPGKQGGVAAGRIVETEAYQGPDDLAAHSSNGRRTKRTEAMFGRAGTVYMFLLYGRSWAFNIVAGPLDHPHAVLVRALEPVLGHDLIAARRGMPATQTSATNGPGKLCSALALDASFYGHDLTRPPLYLTDGPRGEVSASSRINIDYAGEWRTRPWRFYERNNRFVSVRPRT